MSNDNLKKDFKNKIVPLLAREFKLSNELAVPRLSKIVVNVGIGEGTNDKSALKEPSEVLELISGQKPKITKARKSEAGFRLRQGAPVGLMVTLRGRRMYDFLDKLNRIVFPQLRDFRGVSVKGFDGRGNYNIGISEYNVFPEVSQMKLDQTKGLQITLVTTTDNDRKAGKMLSLLGVPFEKNFRNEEGKPKINN